jgi:photosystem I reaction center subunit VIII
MAASFLPSILVPIVGLVFPAFSMALFSSTFRLMMLINFFFKLIIFLKIIKLKK